MPSNLGAHLKEIVRWTSKEEDVHVCIFPFESAGQLHATAMFV